MNNFVSSHDERPKECDTAPFLRLESALLPTNISPVSTSAHDNPGVPS